MGLVGMIIDNRLCRDTQCDKLCANVSCKILVLRKHTPFIQSNTLQLLYIKKQSSLFDHACSVFCHTKQKQNNAISRYYLGSLYTMYTTDCFPDAMWLNTNLPNQHNECMMTSLNGNIFRVTGLLCGEFTGPRWISRTKASDAELWCFLWSVPE